MQLHVIRKATGVALLTALLLITVGLGPADAATDPAQIGSWSAPMPLGVVGVHAALLHTGKLLYYELPGSTLGHARLFDPLTGQSTPVDPHLDWSVFCSGISTLPDGRLFATGGEPPRTQQNPVGTGVENAAFFDPVTQTWTGAPPMQNPRWYPANVDMPDGTVLVMGGERVPTGGSAKLVDAVESFDPATSEWTTLPHSADISGLYPRGILLPNGHVLVPGPQRLTEEFNPATDRWSSISNMLYGARDAGGVVLLPGLQRVLTSGGTSGGHTGTKTAEILDLSTPSPHWTSTGSMATARMHHNLVLLPDGTVLAVGGAQVDHFGSPVETSELYNSATGTWRTMDSQLAPRAYHSTALLLPDGRVISAGSNSGSTYEDTVEFYSPPYLFKGPRPLVTSAPDTIGYAEGFDVATPDADRIARVTLMRLGATTHGWDTSQRSIDLDFSSDAGVLHIDGPSDTAEAPPGYYMLFVLDANGVPSVAPIMALSTTNVGHDLTVETQGDGSVTSDVGGIDCPAASCHAGNLEANSHVILVAAPDPGHVFVGWTGGCTGDALTCDVSMDADLVVTATFAPAVDLSVTMAGGGTGTVRAPPDDAIDCPSTCAGAFMQGGSVTLHADAGPDSVFAGWSGDTADGCPGTDDCTLPMDVSRVVTATFDLAWDLHVELIGAGAGAVTSDVGGIGCGDTCERAFVTGATVTLHAADGPNAIFDSWGGDTDGACPGTEDCVVTMDRARIITATYVPILHQLSVTTSGAGAGTVTSLMPNAGIDCGATCAFDVQQGSTVVLHAEPDASSLFGSWTGGGCFGSADCTVSIDAAASVDARFDPAEPLTTVVDGLGTGSITSDLGGVTCPWVCAAKYTPGTEVVLTATATDGSTFAGWSGGICSGTGACLVTMDGAKSVIATFDRLSLPIETSLTDGDPAVSYDGWSGVADAAASGGSYRMSHAKNDTAAWQSPTTRSITWVTRTGPDQGKASVSIDGVNKGTVDLYAPAPAVLARVYSGLRNKPHVIVIRVLHSRSTASTGYNVRLDAFVVGATTTQESSPAIRWNAWTSSTQATATDGTYRATTRKTAAVKVSFIGTSITWTTARGKGFGKASVTVDGVTKGVVDLYQAATVWRSSITYGGLAPGTHTLVIQVLGVKDPAATSTKVVVDGFIVRS